jgi:nicotinate-nucleotide pyrophosphorylase (carboxylating)
MNIPAAIIDDIVARALREDVGHGDVTTEALIPADARAMAQIVSREEAIVAGVPVAAAVFAAVDATLSFTTHTPEGARVAPGEALATIRGSARSILTAERVALNLLQRMCGTATLTARFVAAIGDHPARLLDTRKTTPGLRALEKYAVRMGGGVNHRFGLFDAILIKDNHLEMLAAHGLSMTDVIRRARAGVGPMVTIEVEVESVDQARAAAEAGADVILLDNMAPEMLRDAVAAIGGRARTEASGGISLATIGAAAASGVDYISVGALTHGARAIDLSLEVRPLGSGE